MRLNGREPCISMDNSKFTVTRGMNGGSKHLTFYYVSKVSFKDLAMAINETFPDISHEDLTVLPGIAFCSITTAKTFEVPTS